MYSIIASFIRLPANRRDAFKNDTRSNRLKMSLHSIFVEEEKYCSVWDRWLLDGKFSALYNRCYVLAEIKAKNNSFIVFHGKPYLMFLI